MHLTPRTRGSIVHTSQGMQLLASRSRRSAQVQFPPQAYEMEGDGVEDVPLGPLGRLYSYTLVASGKTTPAYGLAMIDFDPGVRVFGRLILGVSRPVLGTQVRVVPHVLSDGVDDYAFQMVNPTEVEGA